MTELLQYATYLIAIYLILKGIEILQIALASNREKRRGIISFGLIVLLACTVISVIIVFKIHEITSDVNSSRAIIKGYINERTDENDSRSVIREYINNIDSLK